MARDLAAIGDPVALPELLDLHECGPAEWEFLPLCERASTRAAIQLLLRHHQVQLDIHGRLCVPRRRAAPNWASLWSTPS
jgi:hypothetical protein